MQGKNKIAGIKARFVLIAMSIAMVFLGTSSCGEQSAKKKINAGSEILSDLLGGNDSADESQIVNALLVSPKNPRPGEVFHVLAVGGKNIRKAQIVVKGQSGSAESHKTRNGDGLPFWRIDEFKAESAGKYKVSLITNRSTVSELEFTVSSGSPMQTSGAVWKTEHGWDSKAEALYSAWINALFFDADERSSWSALHEVMQNKDRNILYNFLSLGEDDPAVKNRVIMGPDCADNPFYLRAYFAWKLGLPFGYHLCDRGGIGRSPKTGEWITNESSGSKNQPVLAFNSFLRRVANGVHSGTARTALKDEASDYYPVPLTKDGLRPGTVFADPYGHTLILVRWVPQTSEKPGVLLSVDAQPDGTVGIKRFWKGNFLFTTNEVIGDPGFKAFRPIILKDGQPRLLKNKEISAKPELIPFSLQQQGMSGEKFYHTMEQLINPAPMDPEMALLDLIQALHEQLTVRITSVANGEAYMKSHPGEVIAMPGGTSGVFQAGGQWEDFSTPNRDLRLLIAMDAVLDFPDKVLRSPGDFRMSKLHSAEHVKKNLEDFLAQKLSELSITYRRTNGKEQKLTLTEILKRKDAFEMAYNPNDGIEIRWGAPENSEERSTCHRHVPAGQMEKMRSVRKWFQKRLHPPT
ncbi:MAG TPA: hypothetical protein VGK38_02530 [Prolixibacteraceae bacterium]